MKRRRWILGFAGLVVAVAAAVTACDLIVTRAAAGKMYYSVSEVPARQVALVPGCVKFLGDGQPNQFFKFRIRAAAELYHAGKIGSILVSGDNSREGYDEPTDMKEALVQAGVPGDKITCDYAGFRTLDSIARAKKVFGLKQVLIVSQHFHNERALYLARCYGLDAIAFNAQDVPATSAIKTSIREVFARVKTVLDMHVLHTRPRYLGPPVKVTTAD